MPRMSSVRYGSAFSSLGVVVVSFVFFVFFVFFAFLLSSPRPRNELSKPGSSLSACIAFIPIQLEREVRDIEAAIKVRYPEATFVELVPYSDDMARFALSP
eukprot:scaffold1414_cov261-Pinguiococcus_pyrenoidosus.AAC.1